MIEVEGVDYVRVPVTDIEQAKDFYGRVLGLPPGPSQLEDWVEYQAGNLTLAVMTPESHGESFAPIPSGTHRAARAGRRRGEGLARGSGLAGQR